MPRGVPKTREAMALFLNPAAVPPEMCPKGRSAKSIKVTVLQETAKQVTLQYTYKPSPRAKNVMHCRATFPADAVVLYELEAVEMEAVDAPAPKKATPAKKKAAPAKKGATKKTSGATGKVILKTIRANKGPMKMPELVEETEFTAPQLRKALGELVEEGIVEKEGAGRSMTYSIKRKKRKGAAKKKGASKKKAPAKKRRAKKKAAPAKKKGKKGKRKGRKSLDDAPSSSPAKKGKKKKKGKKTRFGSSSRRKSSFKLDPEDD